MLNATRVGSRFLSKLNGVGQNVPVLASTIGLSNPTEQRRHAKKWYPDKNYLKQFEEEVYLVSPEPYVISKNVKKGAPEVRVRNMVINMGPAHPSCHDEYSLGIIEP